MLGERLPTIERELQTRVPDTSTEAHTDTNAEKWSEGGWSWKTVKNGLGK